MLPGLPEVTSGGALDVIGAATGSAQPTILLATFAVVLARMIGFIIVAPFFGGMNIPMAARVGLAVVITAVITPMLAGSATTGLAEAYPTGLGFLLLLVNQVLIGLMFGFVASFVFYGIESAGRVIDTQRGSNMSDILAPMTGERTSPSGQWLMMVALMVLLTSGLHLVMLEAMIQTFRLFPPTSSLDWIGIAGKGELENLSPVMHQFVHLSGQSLLITIKVAAPAMISLMLADVLLGIINRGAPQVNVFALSQVIKGPIGIGGLLVSLVAIVAYMENDALASIPESIEHMARLMDGTASRGG